MRKPDYSFNDFKACKLYTANNKTIDGFIDLVVEPTEKVRFKREKSSLGRKLNLDSVKSVVVEKDSLVVITKFGTKDFFFDKGLARVHSTDSIKIYIHEMIYKQQPGITTSLGLHYSVFTHVISRDNKIFQGVWNIKQQRIVISHFFKDCPDLMNRIQNKEFDKKTILDIVEEYNSWLKTK